MRPGRFARGVVLLNCLVPVTLLAWDAARGQLGANPVNFAIRTTGLLALIFLVLTLAVTPAARLTGRGGLGAFRRMLGLCAFFHAALHFLLFFGFDRAGDLRDTVSEMIKRPYLVVGSTALLLMVPLAATSTDRMIRRLGGRRWKQLHRLTYVIVPLAALHFYMLVKADVRRPVAFAAATGLLLAYRPIAYALRRRPSAVAPASTAPAAASEAVPRFWRGRLRVAGVVQETPDVRTFRLVTPNGAPIPFQHRPGQYLNLALRIDGQRVNRSYTIASPPSRPDACEITVRRNPEGVGSRHLHDAIREGDFLDVSGPSGKFTFDGDGEPGIVLIAGGVGITPLMAKIRYLSDIGWGGAIDLVYAARTEADVIFREELESLRGRVPGLNVTVTLTGEAGPSWAGERGRITADLLGRVVPGISTRRVHVCGPPAMMDATRAALRTLGVSDGQVRVESFLRTVPSKPGENGRAAGAPAQSATLAFARSGVSGPIGADRTILEAAEALGVGLPFDCRAGLCGQCKTRLVSGEVVMEAEDALTPADRDAGLILACQSRCLGDVIVDA